MVKTRSELKIKLNDWINDKKEFTTKEAVNYAREIAPNINTSVMRIVNYIKRSAVFENDVWIKPKTKLEGE
jgi:hypothetical protein